MSEKLTEAEREALRDWWDDTPNMSEGTMLNELDSAVEAILAARLARVEAEGVNKGVRLAAQLVKDHALGENTTPGQVVTFLLARADRAALRSDAHAEQKGEQP